MAISAAAGKITIAASKITGTAESGTATTLTDSASLFGATNSLANYVVYIASGTGAGQSRRITANSATVLTVDTWTTNPGADSVYHVCYSEADLVAAGVGASWATNAADRDVIIATSITAGIDVTGYYASLYANYDFLADRSVFFADSAGSFMQLGFEQPDGAGFGGGQMIWRLEKGASPPQSAYFNTGFRGTLRLYGVRIFLKKDPLFNDREMTYNYFTPWVNACDELDVRNCTVEGLTLAFGNGDICKDTLFTLRMGATIVGQPSVYSGNVTQSVGTWLSSNVINGLDITGLKFIGDTSAAFVTQVRQLFCNSTAFTSANGSKAYFIDPDFGATAFADAMTWFNGAGVFTTNQHIYKARKIVVKSVNTALSALGSVNVRLIDVSGNAAWTTSKHATTFVPVKVAYVTTDPTTGLTASAYVVTEDQYCNDNVTTPTGDKTANKVTATYRPFTMTARKYAYVFQNGLPRDWTSSQTEQITMAANAFTVANEATAGALTGITIDGAAKTIAVSGTRTMQELYDYSQWWAAQTDNLGFDEPITTSDGVTFTLAASWAISVSGSLTGTSDILADKANDLTVASGGFFEDAQGAIWNTAGTLYYASHAYLNVKDASTSANIESAVIGFANIATGVELIYSTALALGGLATDADGNAEGYFVWKIGATTYADTKQITGEYGYGFSTIPRSLTGSPVGSAAARETIRLIADSEVTLTKTNALLVAGITVTGASTLVNCNDNDNTETYDNLKARQARDTDIESGVPGWLNFGLYGLLLTKSGSTYTAIDTWTYQNIGVDSTWKNGLIVWDTAATITMAFENADFDFTGAGTFDLRGSTFAGTIDVDTTNDSTVTAQFPTGASVTNADPTNITVTASTAIAIANANLADGTRVRLYNVTQDAELANAVVSGGAGYTANFTVGTGEEIEVGDTITMTTAYASGTSYKNETTESAVAGTSNITMLSTQSDNAVLNGYSIDGSAVTEYTADYPNVQVDIDTGDTTRQRLLCWIAYIVTSEDGIRNFFGAVTHEDAANAKINTAVVDLHLDYVGTGNSRFTDQLRVYRDDGTTLFAGAGDNFYADSGKVFVAETGVSGLTPEESDQLLALTGGATAAEVRIEMDANSTKLGAILGITASL